MSGTGDSYGSGLEHDPNGILAWVNGASFTCTWTGAVDTAWNNPGNWSACANARGGFPDANDRVIIPAAPLNQPLVSGGRFHVRNFAPGTGGGMITIAASSTLETHDRTNTFASDIAFQGQVVPCNTCALRSGTGATIYNSATVSLLEGLTWELSHGQNVGQFRVGNGTSGGTLRTGPADPSIGNRPRISVGGGTIRFWVSGGLGDRAHIAIDGLRLFNLISNLGNAIEFADHFEIDQFDNFLLDAEYTMQGNYIRISDCTNAAFNDLSWDQIDFVDAIYDPPAIPPAPAPPKTGRNINITNCAGVGPLNIYPRTGGSNLGFGAADAEDPDNVLVFH